MTRRKRTSSMSGAEGVIISTDELIKIRLKSNRESGNIGLAGEFDDAVGCSPFSVAYTRGKHQCQPSACVNTLIRHHTRGGKWVAVLSSVPFNGEEVVILHRTNSRHVETLPNKIIDDYGYFLYGRDDSRMSRRFNGYRRDRGTPQ